MTIKTEDFTVKTKCKGYVKGRYGDVKITNNSNHVIFFKGKYIGEERTNKDAIALINNLVKYQKLEFTQE